MADAVNGGAKLVLGGNSAGGTYYMQTVLTGCNATMKITREETFGPVAGLVRFESDGEVIAAANDTEFGLASYVFTRDLARSWWMMEALECGMVGVNTGHISTELAPFGGIKQSGMGREGSRHGLEDYLELKYCCISM